MKGDRGSGGFQAPWARFEDRAPVFVGASMLAPAGAHACASRATVNSRKAKGAPCQEFPSTCYAAKPSLHSTNVPFTPVPKRNVLRSLPPEGALPTRCYVAGAV